MTQQRSKSKNILLLIPVFGTLLFIILYFIAALLYPGGSQANKDSQGFSWINNYWCNLLNEPAINGQHNPAKPVAIVALFMMCATLSSFWLVFPKNIPVNNKLKLTIQIAGLLAMIIALFLFTNFNHDAIINFSCSFGVIASICSFIVLYKIKWYGLFSFGVLNILLVGINNYVYYKGHMIVYLPLIQKISFASFLIWICWITIELYRAKEINRA